MFRFLENLVDPYEPHMETNTPPRRLWPFMRGYSSRFHRVFIAAMGPIMVSDDGSIVERGHHDRWLTYGSMYARFWMHQSGGLIGTEAEE